MQSPDLDFSFRFRKRDLSVLQFFADVSLAVAFRFQDSFRLSLVTSQYRARGSQSKSHLASLRIAEIGGTAIAVALP